MEIGAYAAADGDGGWLLTRESQTSPGCLQSISTHPRRDVSLGK